MAEASTEFLTTADGRPLKAALAAAQSRAKRRAFILVLPLLLFVFLTFLVPIGYMLKRSVEHDGFSASAPALDAWFMRGRQRFGDVRMLNRADGVKPIISNLRKGGLLYLLSDMDFGPGESIFVPFYGVPTATVPSLPRFARLGRAKVIGMYTRLTPTGYVAEITPAWEGYPSDDVEADTAQMNLRLQSYIDTMPGQYYWVHKRFKTRPAGEPSVY